MKKYLFNLLITMLIVASMLVPAGTFQTVLAKDGDLSLAAYSSMAIGSVADRWDFYADTNMEVEKVEVSVDGEKAVYRMSSHNGRNWALNHFAPKAGNHTVIITATSADGKKAEEKIKVEVEEVLTFVTSGNQSLNFTVRTNIPAASVGLILNDNDKRTYTLNSDTKKKTWRTSVNETGEIGDNTVEIIATSPGGQKVSNSYIITIHR